MKAAAPRTLVVPQIIDFLKIARRQPTRVFVEGLVRRGQAPPSLLERSDAEIEAEPLRHLGDARLVRDLRYGYRQTIEDLALAEIRAPPRRLRGARRAGPRPAASTASSCTSPTPTPWRRSFPSRTDAPTPTAAASRTVCACPLEVIEAVRGGVGRDFLVGCRYLGSEDILAEDGQSPRQRLSPKPGGSAWPWPAPASTSCPFPAGASSTTPSSPRWARPPTPTRATADTSASPARRETRPRSTPTSPTGIRSAVRAAGLTTPVVASGKISTFEVGRTPTSGGPRRPHRYGPRPPRRPRPSAEVAIRPRRRRCGPASSAPSARKRTSTTAW